MASQLGAELEPERLARLRVLADAAHLPISDARLAEIAPLAEVLLERFSAFAALEMGETQPASTPRPPRRSDVQ
jgi:hypothetical protein